jgi:hypothetical protein
MMERKIIFESDVKLAGVLRYSEGNCVPAVLLIHGTLEQDRDGNMIEHPDGRKLYRKNFFLEISKHLCKAGFATFSWDRRGFGESNGPRGDVFSTVKDAIAALDVLCSQNVVDSDRIAVLGQSAGVYTACLLAKEDDRAKAYVLQGGLYRDYSEIMAFNYLRVKKYAESSPKNLRWVEENDLWSLVIGLNLHVIEKHAREGRTECKVSYKDRSWRIPLDPLLYTPEYAPSRQFRYIRRPTFIVHGECDLNVPVEDAYMIERELRINGVDVELAVIPNSDHSFQEVAEDEETRLKERMSLKSFKRPYRREYFEALIDFLRRKLK